MKIRSVVLLEVANRQTDKQTNAGYNTTSLTEVIKRCRTEAQICAMLPLSDGYGLVITAFDE